MEREDIEKAAKDYSIGKTYFRRSVLEEVYAEDHVLRKDNCREDFIAGAEWRINSVWHKPCDIAELGKDCLVEHMDGDGNVCICIDWRSEYEWVKSCHYDKILSWAYIDDLLPILC
jgi:hypothetical protein|nr:MAG TPA: hypothetical protein [Caudoviricetes sp.]